MSDLAVILKPEVSFEPLIVAGPLPSCRRAIQVTKTQAVASPLHPRLSVSSRLVHCSHQFCNPRPPTMELMMYVKTDLETGTLRTGKKPRLQLCSQFPFRSSRMTGIHL